MFHSSANKELDLFVKWRNDFREIQFNLVLGNHDILPAKFYKHSAIDVFKEAVSIKNFCFKHDINSSCGQGKNEYTFSGHIHPGVKLNGAGNQSLMLPCFYFGKKYAVLPAFSAFTGLAKIKPNKTDSVFALVEGKVLKIQ